MTSWIAYVHIVEIHKGKPTGLICGAVSNKANIADSIQRGKYDLELA